MRQITVYQYDELPTEEAKQKARAWWRNLELDCPAWQEEHFESRDRAIVECMNIEDTEENREMLIKKSEDCDLTGYCADVFLSSLIKTHNRLPTDQELINKYREEWEDELYNRMGDIEYIEETIRANEYEFLEDGRRL